MSFLKTSTSFSRFKVRDEVENSFWQEVGDKLRQFSFKDIDELPEDRAWGWASFEDMLDVDWRYNPPQKGAEYLTFTLRLETRRVPPAVIKKHFGLALRKEEEQIKQLNKTFVSRERKKEIKEQVMMVLKKRFLPIPAEFQVIWNTTTGEVWFASTQGKMLEIFEEFFTHSFGLYLERLTPYGLAAEILGEDQLSKLDSLESTSFYKV
ncbi:recombination-associated protein RdgC [Desulfovibrio sp. OttesenSCG-928-C06]|nr:recombination-associated protein RdgC [Desulfovibrio sp. OttesenSCG-928-C06]